MSTDTWSGTLHLARDFALLHGRAGATDMHAHYAHQLIISTDAPVTVRMDSQTQQARRILIESMRMHAIVAAPATVFTIYIEPLSVDRASLTHSCKSTRCSTARSAPPMSLRMSHFR
jgi:hypothetical protein